MTPTTSHKRDRHPTRFPAVIAVSGVLLAGCGGEFSQLAKTTTTTLNHAKPVLSDGRPLVGDLLSQLRSERDGLTALKPSELAAEEAKRRSELLDDVTTSLRRHDDFVEALVTVEVSSAAKDAELRLQATATSLAMADSVPNRKQEFLDNLKNAGIDQARGAACEEVQQAILSSPTATQEDRSALGARLAEGAQKALAETYDAEELKRVVSWVSWGQSAADLATSVAQLSPKDAVELSTGPRPRAFYYYLKLCHATPRVS